MQGEHFGMVNRQSLWYDEISEMRGGYAVCNSWTPTAKTWCISDDGTMVETEPTSFSPSSSDGLAATSTNWQCAYYSLETGSMAFSVDCQEARPFSEGLAAVQSEDRYGYIDTTGALVIDAVYTDAGEFHEGLALVQTENGESSFIDTSGTVRFSIGTMKSDGVFHDGSVVVQKGKRYGIMDAEGVWLLRPTRQVILWSDAGFYCAHGTMGLETYCPRTGKPAVP
ncbi:MAG: WG repeat-containing protein [Oscillospiraceae bacterium]|nr:WG repeat-containing protein [Oscillospiraceae bacterium]